jgi:hypothetical protein
LRSRSEPDTDSFASRVGNPDHHSVAYYLNTMDAAQEQILGPALVDRLIEFLLCRSLIAESCWFKLSYDVLRASITHILDAAGSPGKKRRAYK